MRVDKDGKLIKFVCDICKEDIAKNDGSRLSLRNANTCLLWEIHSECLATLQALVGEGRVSVPYPSPHLLTKK